MKLASYQTSDFFLVDSLEEIIQNYKLFTPLHRYFRGYVERRAPNLAKIEKKIILLRI